MINPPRMQGTALRVGFVTPSLSMGGAERWIMSLAKNMRTVDTVGIAFVGGGHNLHRNMCREALRICPVWAEMGSDFGMTHVPSHRDAVQAVCDRSDIVITWGIPHTLDLFKDFHLPIIDVSHLEPKCKGNVEDCNLSWRGVSHIAAISKAAAQSYPASLQRYVTILYNGAEVDRVTPRKGRAAMRTGYGFSEDDRVLLHVGRFHPQKHPELLIQALSHLPANWKVALVGTGTPAEEQLLVSLAGAEAPGRVVVCPSSTHVGDFLAMGDVYALVSEFEGFPLTMIEAWLAGIPVVVTPFGCIEELTEMHGELYTVLPERRTAKTLADAVVQAEAEGRASEKIVKARTIAWNNYTVSQMAYRWETYLIHTYQSWQNMQINLPAMSPSRPILHTDMV